ncbi:Bardet-Biedl syndrome 7 protein homolog isoform X1 [Cydia splendana]|uniref:Bardet-Biedl syndrome 7 protein homolog isoform X1 n=1 Tax=Cydia splendana TaxID=1100963 RepID=UPI00300C0154
MEYDFSRIDYAICGITYPDTLKILPAPGPKTQQKFVIGDKNGVLQCLSIKDEEAIVQFKTLPGKPITAVQLATNDGSQADKVFAASGNEVKGYTRKGKVFLSIETALSETITSISYCKNHCRSILAGDLILCSGRTVTHYRDLREFHSYICEDRVLDIASFATPNNTRVRLLVLIANKGAVMLENGQVAAKAVVTSGPSRLLVPPPMHVSDLYSFYGAADGSVGLVAFEDSTLTSKCLVEGKGLGSVMCLGWYFSNGNSHLAVGRHDGSVQLYLVDMENLGDKPRLKYTYFSGEPVTSVSGGCVGTEESELLVTTFSGRVFALRSRRLVSGSGMFTNVPPDAIAARRSKLEVEVARLEKQAANEREKYHRNTRSLEGGLTTPPLLDIQYELLGASKDGWQEARIMAPVPLDMLFIYCNRKLDMKTDSAAVLSVCPSQESSSDFLATVRCQAGTRRLWVRMRHAGPAQVECARVLIYALPAGAPRVARLMILRLPALPYYSQHEDPDSDSESRAWCVLSVSGSFSVAEVTAWLSEALPGELPRPAASVAVARSHSLLKTILVCRLQRGQAVFKSDNVSTIATMRDVISNCSLRKSIRLETSCDIPEAACIKSFKRIEEQFKAEHKKYENVSLKKALNALDLDENVLADNDPVLCEDYLRVWEAPLDDEADAYFQILVDTVMQWYTDWKKNTLYRTEPGNEKSELLPAIKDCNLDIIYKILSNESQSPSSPDLSINKI